MKQKLYIIRGIPGSGKTTRAKELAGSNHFEADQHMTDSDGNYKFDPSRLGYCHQQCQRDVQAALQAGIPVIAVSNTFVKKRDYAPYVRLARIFGAEVEIIVMSGNWGNVHNVPAETVERMRQQFEF